MTRTNDSGIVVAGGRISREIGCFKRRDYSWHITWRKTMPAGLPLTDMRAIVTRLENKKITGARRYVPRILFYFSGPCALDIRQEGKLIGSLHWTQPNDPRVCWNADTEMSLGDARAVVDRLEEATCNIGTRAIISGQVGAAVFLEGGQIWSVTVDDPIFTKRGPGGHGQFQHIFHGAGELGPDDLIEFNNVTRERTWEYLILARRRNRAIQLSLILLDPDDTDSVRTSAARAINGQLDDAHIWDYMLSKLRSAPLPNVVDLPGAETLARKEFALRTAEFVRQIDAVQVKTV